MTRKIVAIRRLQRKVRLVSNAVGHKPYGPAVALYTYFLLKRHESQLGRDCLCHKKNTSYDLIFLIVDRLMKMVHYEPVQIMIDAPALAGGYTPSTCPLQERPYPLFQVRNI